MHLLILIVNVVLFTTHFTMICAFFLKGAEAQSQLRRPGESELDYYERRYQERVNLIVCYQFLVFFIVSFSNDCRVVFVQHLILMIPMLN